MALWMGLKECVCSIKCLAKLDDWLAVLNAFLCSVKRVTKFLPVCPTYAFPQSGHVNLYTPDCECISVFCCLCDSSVGMELLILNAIFVSLFEKVGDEVGFFTDVCESGPLRCWGLCARIGCLFFVGVGWWAWRWRVDWEAVVVWDVLDGGGLCLVVVFL